MPMKKKQRLLKNAEFSDGFQFTNPGNDYNYDAWSEVKKYMKKWTSSSLDANIERIRTQKLSEKKIVENDDAEKTPDKEPDLAESENGVVSDASDTDEESLKPGMLQQLIGSPYAGFIILVSTFTFRRLTA